VSALSYYLERDGIMTEGISLVRENSQSMQPPRALWVSLPLVGRPPGDTEFQHRVIDAALSLLTAEMGPVLVDYPEDAPTVSVDNTPTYPVSFVRLSDDSEARKAALVRGSADPHAVA
jgi:hypothetical protein